MSPKNSGPTPVPFVYKPSETKVLAQLTAFANRYQPVHYKNDIILEFVFTNLDSRYQLVMGVTDCVVKSADFVDFTTQIEISFDIFEEVAFKGLCIKEVILNNDCQINGAFATIIAFEDYFDLTKKEIIKKATLNLMIIQWMMIWMVMSFDVFWGSIAGIVYSSLMPLLSRKFLLTFYDRLSIFLVTALCLLGLVAVDETLIVCTSYFLFGAMWLGSCLTKAPLTVHYKLGKFGYRGYYNQIFLDSNRIITAMWGVYYLIVTGTTYLLDVNGMRSLSGILNLLIPVLLGLVTVKFVKIYPEKRKAALMEQLAAMPQE